MKLIQLNTWSFKLPTEMIRLVKGELPDIVCLQEVVSADSDGKILGTIENVVESHPFKDYYYTPLVEFSFMHHRAKRGNMIASQHTIASRDEIWTHGSYTEDFDYVEAGGYNVARNIAHARITTSHGSLHVLTLHGYHIKEHKNGNEETMHACKVLVEYAKSIDGAVIIAGDFNLAPESASLQIINDSFRNLCLEAGFTTTRNYLTEKTEVCDYIFINENIAVNSISMSNIIASDHNALILDFDIKSS